jgi:hypothetical protein
MVGDTMSFWESIKNKETVVLSDDAIDLLSDTLLEIKKIYQEDLERMPTVAELEALILKALQLDSNINEQLGEMEIVDVNFKLKKKRKTPNIEPGIVFAIPLKEIEKYAYGLVVKGKGLKDDIYIQYFDIFTNEILDIKNFSNQFEKLFVLYTINSGIYGIVNKEWRIIGKLSKGKFNPEEYELPDFVFYNGKEYFVSRGDANTPIAELEPISKEEGEKIKNPIGLIGSNNIVEMLINSYYEKQNQKCI